MLADLMGVQNAIIAIEENKADTFPKIEQLIADDPRLHLYPLKCKYRRALRSSSSMPARAARFRPASCRQTQAARYST